MLYLISHISNLKKGFSLVELILVMSIIATLIGLITINFVNIHQTASLDSLVQDFVSDIKQQQIKAMAGDTEGSGSANPYGVHIDTNRYVLFRGSSYSSFDSSNFNVNLPSNMQFILPASDVMFQKIKGEISAASSFTLKDITNGNVKTITINKYGVITSVN